MKYSRIVYLLVVLFVAFYFSGCAGRPVEMIDKTEKAAEQARAEHADEFAPEDWRAAEQAWKDAQARLDQEKWGEANTALLRAKTRYEKARDIAQGKREDAIREITGYRTTAELRTKTLREAIEQNAARLGAKKKSLEDSCKDLDEKIAKVKTQLDNGQYNDAKYLAQTTMREVWEVQQELDKLVGGGKKK